MPGLWDMHVHTISPGFAPGAAIDDLAALYLANGITGVREMGYYPETTLELRRRIDDGTIPGPRMVIGGMVDGSPAEWPFAISVSSADDARAVVRRLKEQGFDFVKAYSFLSREAYFALVNEARVVGMPVVGHIPITVSASEAAEAGQVGIEHLGDMYTMAIACSDAEEDVRSLVSASPETREGRVEALLAGADLALKRFDREKCRSVIKEMAKRGVWQTPTVFAMQAVTASAIEYSPPLDRRSCYLPKTILDFWRADPTGARTELDVQRRLAHFYIYRSVMKLMLEENVRMLAGTDSPVPNVYPGFALHDELEAMVKFGMSPVDALRAATSAPAEFLGLANELGAVEAGKAADLVLLSQNPLDDINAIRAIEAVISKGRMFSRLDLDSLLAEARDNSTARCTCSECDTADPASPHTIGLSRTAGGN